MTTDINKTDIFCLDATYSTTRLVTRETPNVETSPDAKFTSVLFLPKGEARKGEGGLRTNGYFKKSLPDKPLITVITVVFNGEKYLEETIQSVINQTYDNVEYIIIDGGSTDGTVDIIKQYEGLIDYWVSEPDNGIYEAMNKGLNISSSAWINFLNSGDLFNSISVINSCIKYLHGDALVIYSDTIFYRDYRNSRYYKHITCAHSVGKIIHQSCIFNKQLHDMYGKYLVKNQLTISDYIFFSLIEDKYWVKIDMIICKYLIDDNVSSGMRHEIQKLSVDLLFNKISFYSFIESIARSYIRFIIIRILRNIIPLGYYIKNIANYIQEH